MDEWRPDVGVGAGRKVIWAPSEESWLLWLGVRYPHMIVCVNTWSSAAGGADLGSLGRA